MRSVLPQLESDLFAAAEARLGAPVGDRPRRRLGLRLQALRTAAPLLAGVLVAVAVAVIALSASGQRSARPVAPAAASADSLTAILGVLRTPSTPADRHPELPIAVFGASRGTSRNLRSFRAGWGDPVLIRSLVRVVPVDGGAAVVTFLPARYRPPRSPEAVGLDIGLRLRAPTGALVTQYSGLTPTGITALRTHGLALFGVAAGQSEDRGVLVVPDGVTRVALAHFHSAVSAGDLRRDPALRHVTVLAGRFHRRSAAVHDNLASFTFGIPVARGRGFVNGVGPLSAAARMTWYSATGAVLRHTTIVVALNVRTQSLGPRR
jgi:hypothetical protein